MYKRKCPIKMKEKSIYKDFTQGSISKQLLWFAIPFMASNALQVLYSTIDMIVVGKYVERYRRDIILVVF